MVLCEKDVFRNFTKFTGKNLCQSLLFNKVADVRPPLAASLKVCNFTKIRLRHGCIFCELSKNSLERFFTEHLRTTASNLVEWWLELAISLNRPNLVYKCFLIDLMPHGETSFKGKRLVNVNIINCPVIVYSERFFDCLNSIILLTLQTFF